MKIAEAILKVSFSVGHVEKNGETTFGSKYRYQKWDDVLPAVRDACVTHGLAIAVSAGMPVHIKTESTDKPICKVQVPIGLTLMTDEEMHRFDFCGECLDIDDKAVQKAITNAVKYWMLKTFMIPCEGVEDNDAIGPEVKQNKTQRATASNTAADDVAQVIRQMGVVFKTWGGTKSQYDQAKADLALKNREIHDAIKECSDLEGFLRYVESVDVKK